MSFLTRSSLKNRLILSLATLAIVALGLISMGSLKQELMPSLQAPMAFISAQSQGLAPEEMASSVTEPVEQAVRAVPGVTSVTSTTSSGGCADPRRVVVRGERRGDPAHDPQCDRVVEAELPLGHRGPGGVGRCR
jgi:hypothetical protein